MTVRAVRRRLQIAAVAAVLAAGAFSLSPVSPAAPAEAWGSNSTSSSPSGCWGGFAGSSSYYTSGGNQYMQVSVGRSGAGCFGVYPTITARYRHSSGSATEIACSVSTEYCSGSRVFLSGRVGGKHTWGSATFNS